MTSRQNSQQDGKKMRSRTTSKSGELCPVCSEEMTILAIGSCDHPVCHRCSTRMRVLCALQHCPICRADMTKVVFVQEKMEFAYILTHRFAYNRKYKVYFEDDKIQSVFHALLDHICKVCEEEFKTLKELEKHMRRHHMKFACEICVQHLKIFSHERNFYSREDLAKHRRVGDADDKSHRGHPLCEFCDKRYLDNDELVRHLRKDHFFCHFCDADGISNQFYSDYNLLRDHFRDQHYLCEEGECEFIEFTNAFAGKIDYQAHYVEVHSKSLRKSHQKQARTLDIEVNWKSRPNTGRGRRKDASVVGGNDFEEVQEESQSRSRGGHGRGRGRGRGRGNNERNTLSEDEMLAMALKASLEESEKQKGGHIHMVDPSLLPNNRPGRVRQDSYHEQTGDFPTIDGQNKDSDSGDDVPQLRKTLANKVAFGANMSVQNGAMGEDDFPALGGAPSIPEAPKSKHGKVWTLSKDDFPSLSKGRNQTAKTQVDDFPALGSVTKSNMHKSAPKVIPPEIKKGVSSNKSNASQRKGIKQRREPSPDPVPVNTSTYQSGTDPMKKQITLIQGSDIVPEKPPQPSFEKAKPMSKASWEDDFPALGGKPVAQAVTWGESSAKSVPGTNKKSGNQNLKQTKNVKTYEEPLLRPDDFPALGGSKVTVAPVVKSQWTEIATKKGGKNRGKDKSQSAKADFPLQTATESASEVYAVDTKWKTVDKKSVKQADMSDSSGDLSQNKNKKKKKNKKKATADNESSDLSSEKIEPVDITPELNTAEIPIPENTTDISSKAVICDEKTRMILEKLYDDEPQKTVAKKPVLSNRESDFPTLSDVMVPAKPRIVFEIPKPTKVISEPAVPVEPKVIPTLSEIAATLDAEPNIKDTIDLSSAMSDLSLQDFPIVGTVEMVAPPKSVPPGLFGQSDKPPGLPLEKSPPPGLTLSPLGVTKDPPPGFASVKPISKSGNRNTSEVNVAEDSSVISYKSFSYQPPVGFQGRNKQLVSDIQDACQNNNEKFTEFKHLSSQFRQNAISASDYYYKCRDVMGKEKFANIFMELLVLLPDISKQQELLQAHSNSTKPARAKKASWSLQEFCDTLDLKICRDCKQVLCCKDFSGHSHVVEDSDFPALSGSSSLQSSGVLRAWVKAK